MFISYIIAMIVIGILLFSAVRLHLSFGLHRGTKAKVKVAGPHVERTLHLHDHIFRTY